jgi:hypothetical protein
MGIFYLLRRAVDKMKVRFLYRADGAVFDRSQEMVVGLEAISSIK